MPLWKRALRRKGLNRYKECLALIVNIYANYKDMAIIIMLEMYAKIPVKLLAIAWKEKNIASEAIWSIIVSNYNTENKMKHIFIYVILFNIGF